MLDRILSWLYTRRLWGRRCPDFDADCVVCQHWLEHDEIFVKMVRRRRGEE